jgi:hypothetical protein
VPQPASRPKLRLVAPALFAAAGLVLVLSVQASLAGGRVAQTTSGQCKDDHGVVEPSTANAPECETSTPTQPPTSAPTAGPTATPTAAPTSAPTQAPTAAPTRPRTSVPRQRPTPAVTLVPTPASPQAPTQSPTPVATVVPAQAVEGATSRPGDGQGGGSSSGKGTNPGREQGLLSELSGDDPIDAIAAGLLDGGSGPSGQGNLGLAGALATAALLLSLGGAVWAGRNGRPSGQLGLAAAGGSGAGAEVPDLMARGSSVGRGAAGALAGAAGAGGGAAGALSAAGALFGGGFNLPLPRADLVQNGLGIFRSMKRVTEEADPSGFSAGDTAQFLGDAAGVAALASVLAPVVGVLSLATSSAAAASDVKSPHEVIEGLRRNFGRLGYMQGIVDANVTGTDGELGEFARTTSGTLPDAPADPAALKDDALASAGAEWAKLTVSAQVSVSSDRALADYLDLRRVELAAQAALLADLLGRSETGKEVRLNDEAAAALAFGRSWYTAGDSARMAADLRASLENWKASGEQAGGTARGGASVGVKPGSKGDVTTLDRWAAESGARDACLGTLEALAGVERWRGFCDAVAGAVGDRLAAAHAQADQTEAVHRELSAEIEHRGEEESGK